jgi:hypothetical protein
MRLLCGAARAFPFDEMVSFSERQIARHAAKQASAVVKLNTKQFSRIFPAGFRVDSSNVRDVPVRPELCLFDAWA